MRFFTSVNFLIVHSSTKNSCEHSVAVVKDEDFQDGFEKVQDHDF